MSCEKDSLKPSLIAAVASPCRSPNRALRDSPASSLHDSPVTGDTASRAWDMKHRSAQLAEELYGLVRYTEETAEEKARELEQQASQLAASEKKLKAAEELVAKLEEELLQCREQQAAELSHLRSAVQQYEACSLDMQMALQDKENKLLEASKRLKEQETKAAEESHELEERSREAHNLQLEVQRLRKELEGQTAQQEETVREHAATIALAREELRLECEKATSLEQAVAEQGADLAAKAEELRVKEEELQAASNGLEALQAALNAQAADLAVKESELERTIQVNEEQKTQLKGLQAELFQQKEASTLRIQEVEDTVQELQVQIKTHEDESWQQADKFQVQSHQLETAQKAYDSCKLQVAELQIELEEKMQDILELNNSLDSERQSTRQCAADLAEARRELRISQEQAMQNFNAKVSELTLQVEEANEHIREQERCLQVQNLELQDRREDLAILGERLEEEGRSYAALECDLKLSKAQSQEAEQHAAELEAELLRERSRLEEQAAQVLALAEELKEGCNLSSYEELRVQNRELALTVQQFKQENELLDAENKSLEERLAVFEVTLDRATGLNAELIGHVNHKQKIRHTMQLKEEISNLRAQLKKAHHKITKLEVNKWGLDFFDALASLGLVICQSEGTDPNTSTCSARIAALATPRLGSPRVQRRCLSARAPSQPVNVRMGQVPDQTPLQLQLKEVERRCYLQQRAFERVSVDFGHFVALIERTVFLASNRKSLVSGHLPLPVLMQRLRDVIVEAMDRRQHGSEVPAIHVVPPAADVEADLDGPPREADLQEGWDGEELY